MVLYCRCNVDGSLLLVLYCQWSVDSSLLLAQCRWFFIVVERQQQQTVEIERYRREAQNERTAADKLRQEIQQIKVDIH